MKNNSLFLAALLLIGVSAFAQNPLTDSLIAYYPFDGNALDASGNGNDGTVNGATLTTDRFGNPNSAYKFDGTNDYIEYIAGSKFKPETFPVSMTAWLKSNTPSDVGTFFKNDNAINVYTGFIFQIQVTWGGVLEVHYGDGGTSNSYHRRSKGGLVPINDNQWHFVACVVRGPTDMDLFIDCNYDEGFYDGTGGELVYTNADGTSGIYDVVAGTYYYKGALDELRFYNRELTLNDLLTIHSFPNPYGTLSVALGTDVNICPGGEVTLSPVVTGDIQSYAWSNGAVSSSLIVDEPGPYWVSVFDGCSFAYDTINVIMSKPISVYLPEDTMVCMNGSLLIDVGSFYNSYLWSTGETTSSILITEPGVYEVTVELNGCYASDSVNVTQEICDGISEVSQHPISLIYQPDNHIVEVTCGTGCNPQKIYVELLNSIGQKVFQSDPILLSDNTSYSFQLPDDISNGVFILNVKTDSESLLRKVITCSR
ncbi:MAG: LamG domain-containing protein [Chitinophagales bacterium]